MKPGLKISDQKIRSEYLNELSLHDISKKYSVSYSFVQRAIKRMQLARPKGAARLLASKHKPSLLRGRKRPPRSKAWCQKISESRKARANWLGRSLKPNGYYEITRGEHKGRGEHRVIWESVYGPIPSGFVIHHIDLNSKNNSISNLKMMSAADHSRYHSAFRKRKKNKLGRFI